MAALTTNRAAHELITHAQDGFLVSPEHPTQLAQHLHTLLQNRQQLLQMSLAALQRYHRHPTWKENMAKIRGFLQGVIGDWRLEIGDW